MVNQFRLTVCQFLMQAIAVHGFQLLDIWMHHSAGDAANSQFSKIFSMSSSAGDSANNLCETGYNKTVFELPPFSRKLEKIRLMQYCCHVQIDMLKCL